MVGRELVLYGRASKTVGDRGGPICRRCLCGTEPNKPWIDLTEQFNNNTDLEMAAQTSS